MRYRVRISEMRYGEAVVESKNEETAQNDAYMNGINWFDHEITDVTVEPYHKSEPSHDCMIVELCPNCMNEIEMRWDTDVQGFKAFCPVCGKCLMLCDECLRNRKGRCSHYGGTDGCEFLIPGEAEARSMDALHVRDGWLRKLWEEFGELPMNPETECMEKPFLLFPVGTHREEIWHWFDERYSTGVYSLLYPSAGSKADALTATELREAYEKQQHIYDTQDIESELEDLSEDIVKKYRLNDEPVTDAELDEMAKAMRRRLDNNADSPWSVCKSEAITEILERRSICK